MTSLWVVWLLFAAASAAAPLQRLLVLSDAPKTIQTSHSLFLKDLADAGFALTHAAIDSNPSFEEFGEMVYHGVVVLSETGEVHGLESRLMSLLDEKRVPLIIAASRDSVTVSDLLNEIQVDVGPDGDEETCSEVAEIPVLVGETIQSVELHAATLTRSQFARADMYPIASKDGAACLMAVQSADDSRVLVLGSLDTASDTALGQNAGARALLVTASLWVLGRRGELRVLSVEWRRTASGAQNDAARALAMADSLANPATVTVNDELVFKLVVEERLWKRDAAGDLVDEWVPFVRRDEMQLEFTMLSPRLRITMLVDPSGEYSAHFRCPDVYGIYKFVVNYHAPGFRPLSLSRKVSVRPYWHNEFLRFIPQAYPYYLSAAATLAGIVVFSAIFLLIKPGKAHTQ